NKEINKVTKDAYLNFLRFSKRLERTKSQESLKKLRDRIVKSGSLNARNWLLEQIDVRLAS
ncbi:MAG: hypothetical protein AAF544_06900, partial [Bacteroidota bacterium]